MKVNMIATLVLLVIVLSPVAAVSTGRLQIHVSGTKKWKCVMWIDIPRRLDAMFLLPNAFGSGR